MPSDIKEGDYEYRDMMDQLNEVIQKYEETYDILLCGDMNASIHRDDRRRNRIFKKFTVESNLILPTNYPIDFTFHHHNGKGKSQIDYILFKGKTLNLQPSVSIMTFDAINLSATLSFIVFFCFLISVCMIFLYSSELHLSHAGLVYILADFGANLLIWVVRSLL
jgi:hypothetical protein